MRSSPRLVLAVATAVLVALMATFAVQIERSQSKSRDDVEERIRERAQVSSALTESIFASTSGSAAAENTRRFGGDVSEADLIEQVQASGLVYLVVLGPSGEVLASSPGTPEASLDALRAGPAHIRRVRAGAPFALSDEVGDGRSATLEYAQPILSRAGSRILVSGFPPKLIHAFLGGYLAQVPNTASGEAYIIDSGGVVVGSAVEGSIPTIRPEDEGLIPASDGGGEGAYGDGRYFTSSPVGNTPWHVVVTASEANLFSSVRGSRKWVPWLLLVGFGAAAVGVLFLIRRVLLGAVRLASANAQLGTTNAALERRAQELARSNAELEQFASIASHDLREPLRKVQIFAAQLEAKEGERLTEDGRGYLRRMSRAGERMQLLIDDLLKFSRVATHAQPFVEVDMVDVVHDCVDDLEVVIAESGGTVDVGELPAIQADPAQMRQMMQNLISNALKFRREGVAPEVRIAGHLRGRLAEVTVADNGIGFDPRYATRIFRVFERLHGKDAYPGTGVGLALCRKIAERHGGAIVADSTPGAGATFTISLPVRHESADEAGPPASGAAVARGEAPYAVV
ncbi:MAG: hypothetical protein H0V81_13350 [Solirubrobacterales bacterium]|nr:hypothetical protein [Solirubrobacterales bacterium]